MSKRKDRLKALFAGEPETGGQQAPEPQSLKSEPALANSGARRSSQEPTTPPSPTPATTPRPDRPRAASGAVKAMGLSLGQMAQDLKDQTGERVVTLNPSKIEPSPVADRITIEAQLDDGFAELKDSLESRGQQVPVLVRRHPDPAKQADGWYQAAYGHRRIRAARELGVEIMAIVRDLSDDALILAQGKENAERRDLSFIEKAFFARSLMDHGFERSVVQDALAVHKAEMTRLLQVADKVPYPIARAIGPAPKAGRPRWQDLAALLDGEAAEVIARDEAGTEAFRTANSDQRFQMIYKRLLNRRPADAGKAKAVTVKASNGAPIADVKGTTIQVSKKMPAAFTDFVAARLPDLLEAYEAAAGEDSASGGDSAG